MLRTDRRRPAREAPPLVQAAVLERETGAEFRGNIRRGLGLQPTGGSSAGNHHGTAEEKKLDLPHIIRFVSGPFGEAATNRAPGKRLRPGDLSVRHEPGQPGLSVSMKGDFHMIRPEYVGPYLIAVTTPPGGRYDREARHVEQMGAVLAHRLSVDDIEQIASKRLADKALQHRGRGCAACPGMSVWRRRNLRNCRAVVADDKTKAVEIILKFDAHLPIGDDGFEAASKQESGMIGAAHGEDRGRDISHSAVRRQP